MGGVGFYAGVVRRGKRAVNVELLTKHLQHKPVCAYCMYVLMWVSCHCFGQVGALLRPRATILLCWPSPRSTGPIFSCRAAFPNLAFSTFTAAMLAMHSIQVQQSQVDLWPERTEVDRWLKKQRVEDYGCRFIHI